MPYTLEKTEHGYKVGKSSFLSKYDAETALKWYNKAEEWRQDREMDGTFSNLNEMQKRVIEGMIRSHKTLPTHAGYYIYTGVGKIPAVMIKNDLRAIRSDGLDVLNISNKMNCHFTYFGE